MKYLRKIGIYLLVILIIIQCYSLLSMIISNKYFYIVIDLLMFLLILNKKKIKMKKSYLIIAGIYVLVLSTLFISGYFRNLEFIFSVILPFPLFIIYLQGDNALEIGEIYTNIVFVIAMLSLFFFFFGSVYGIIRYTEYYPYSIVGWGRNNYYDYYHLYCQGQEASAFGYAGVRNIGLFVEGPMLTYVVSIALYYELFLRKKSFRKIYVAVLLVTIVTSLSTTGLLVAVILLYLRFYNIVRKNVYIRYFFIPIVFCVIGYILYYIIQDKFTSNIFSASTRVDDILASFKCFFSHIINGVGYQNMKAIDPYRSLKISDPGLSTGIGAILAYGGMEWGIWYFIPFIIAVKNYITNKNNKKNMAFVIMAFFLLLVTVVQNRILCTVVNAVCWYIVLNEKKENVN